MTNCGGKRLNNFNGKSRQIAALYIRFNSKNTPSSTVILLDGVSERSEPSCISVCSVDSQHLVSDLGVLAHQRSVVSLCELIGGSVMSCIV